MMLLMFAALALVLLLAVVFALFAGGGSSRIGENGNGFPKKGASMADVERLANSGQMIEAIKAYREIHRVGLGEAKEAVDRMVNPDSNEKPLIRKTGPTMADVERLANSGETIAAIKTYREVHGVGLKEAKDAVEKLKKTP